MGDSFFILAAFTLANGLTVTGIVLAVLAGLALAVGYFRANLGKSTIDLYRQDNDALRARVKTQDEDLLAKDKRIAELEAQVKEKDQQIAHIRDIATGTTAIDALRVVEEREHRALLDAFNTLQRAVMRAVGGRGGEPGGTGGSF